VPESAHYGDDCPDLFRLRQRLEGPAATLPARANALLDELRATHHCGQLQALLGRARVDLARALDSVRLDEPDDPDSGNPMVRCPELPIVLERLGAAVASGAPLFNRGDREGCRRLYEGAARVVRDRIIPVARCPVVRGELDSALNEAASATDAGEAAWALRRGFDRISGRARNAF
jgi:hypothetical protein